MTIATSTPTRTRSPAPPAKPRLGFAGLGWIGRMRMQSLIEAGAAEPVALVDIDPDAIREAGALAPDAETFDNFGALLEQRLDGIVIATPNALHAGEATAALERGIPVFCQKPLATTLEDTRKVIEAARKADVLLGVDLSYRHVEGLAMMREAIQAGSLGSLLALDLTFHNAFGPNRPWSFARHSAGGGCLLDLGIHLVDLACWLTGERLDAKSITLRRKGGAVDADGIEDFAWIELCTRAGTPVRIACSWNLSAGADCHIRFEALASERCMRVENIDGSFFDFRTSRCESTHQTLLHSEGAAWGGKAAIEWARRIGEGEGFSRDAEVYLHAMELIDATYKRGLQCASS